MEPTLFEIWSRSRNDLLNKYLLQTVWRIIGRRKTNFYLHWYLLYYCYRTVLSGNILLGLEPEPKIFFGSTTSVAEPEPIGTGTFWSEPVERSGSTFDKTDEILNDSSLVSTLIKGYLKHKYL